MGLEKEIESLTASDLQELIDNAVSERKTVDYKQLLKLLESRAKKKATVSLQDAKRQLGLG